MIRATKSSNELDDYGRIYLAVPKAEWAGAAMDHLVYKLHSVGRDGGRRDYRWLALWNSSCYHGPFGRNTKVPPFRSIKAAIEWIEDDAKNHGGAHVVVETHFGELIGRGAVRKLYRAAGIKP